MSTPYWHQLFPATPPSARQDFGMVALPSYQELLLFGGDAHPNHFAPLNDLYTFNCVTSQWSQRSPSGTPPSPRWGFAMALDSIRNRVVIHGGVDISTEYFGDTLEYSRSDDTWYTMTPTFSPPDLRGRHAMAFDPIHGECIMHAGLKQYPPGGDQWDTYGYDGVTWTQYFTATSPSEYFANPPPFNLAGLEFHRMEWDPIRQKVLLYGGFPRRVLANPGGGAFLYNFNFVFAWDGDAKEWILLQEGKPSEIDAGKAPGPKDFAFVYPPGETQYSYGRILTTFRSFPPLGRLLLHAGWGYPSSPSDLQDLWSFRTDVNEWIELVVTPTPGARESHDMSYDALNSRMIMFGGLHGTYPQVLKNDTWELVIPPPTLVSFNYHT